MGVNVRFSSIKASCTDKRYSKWPWTNCDQRLDGWGYRLEFNEQIAQSKRMWITRPSNILVKSEAECINFDLKNKVIDIVAVDSDLDSASPPQKKTVTRRKRKQDNDLETSTVGGPDRSASVGSSDEV